MSAAARHLRVQAGGHSFLLDLARVAFVSRVRSDSRTLRFPKRDVPLTSLAWLLGLAPGSPSEAVVVEVGGDYRALAVDATDLAEGAPGEEPLDIDALFILRDLSPEASKPPH